MCDVHVRHVHVCDVQVVGEYHLGDMVNRFQHGSLVMQLPDNETARIPTLLFGTILGIIGVIASIPREQYQFLERLQVPIHSALAGDSVWLSARPCVMCMFHGVSCTLCLLVLVVFWHCWLYGYLRLKAGG